MANSEHQQFRQGWWGKEPNYQHTYYPYTRETLPYTQDMNFYNYYKDQSHQGEQVPLPQAQLGFGRRGPSLPGKQEDYLQPQAKESYGGQEQGYEGYYPETQWSDLPKAERLRELKREELVFREEDAVSGRMDYNVDEGRPTNTWIHRGMRGYDLFPYGDWWRPRCDILEDSKHVRVEFEIPGIPPEDINVRISNDMLILSSLKPLSNKDATMYYLQNERHYGHFYRKIVLPDYVDTSKNVGGVLENGVLKITLDKLSQDEFLNRGRKVEIHGPNIKVLQQSPKHAVKKTEEYSTKAPSTTSEESSSRTPSTSQESSTGTPSTASATSEQKP